MDEARTRLVLCWLCAAVNAEMRVRDLEDELKTVNRRHACNIKVRFWIYLPTPPKWRKECENGGGQSQQIWGSEVSLGPGAEPGTGLAQSPQKLKQYN